MACHYVCPALRDRSPFKTETVDRAGTTGDATESSGRAISPAPEATPTSGQYCLRDLPSQENRIAECNGQHPTCGRCLKENVTCTYRSPKRQNAEELLTYHETLLRHLRRLPEESAIHLLRRLRLTQEPESFVKGLHDEATTLSLVRPSDLAIARSTGPARTMTEFELLTGHNASYLKINTLDPSLLERLARGSRSTTAATADALNDVANIVGIPARAKLEGSSSSTSAHPQPPTELCDKRLEHIQLDYWSKVPVSRNFAAAALSQYLRKDYELIPFFNADVVLDDLVTCLPRFCNPFFVSSLLFVAFQAYTLIDVTAASMATRFAKEAEMLHRGEETADTVANVAALMLYGHGFCCYGKEDSSQGFLSMAHAMGHRLALFDTSKDDPRTLSFRTKPLPWIEMVSPVAWGAFSYFAVFNTFYPRDPVRYPPVLPMPGMASEGLESNSSSGTAPLSLPLVSPYFHTQCQLWVITLQVWSVFARNQDVSISDRVPLAFVEGKYRDLLACMDKLGEHALDRAEDSAPALTLYIFFNVIVSTMFLPYTQVEATAANRLRSFAAQDSHPKNVYAASVDQLKYLIVRYYLLDGSAMSILVNPAFVVLLRALLEDEGSADASNRSYFLLCMRCCSNLNVAYPIFYDIGRAYLSRAWDRRAISNEEATDLSADLRRQGKHHEDFENVVCNAILDNDLALTAPDRTEAHTLAEMFEDHAMFEELTTGVITKDN